MAVIGYVNRGLPVVAAIGAVSRGVSDYDY
jgi:hypothetical protein